MAIAQTALLWDSSALPPIGSGDTDPWATCPAGEQEPCIQKPPFPRNLEHEPGASSPRESPWPRPQPRQSWTPPFLKHSPRWLGLLGLGISECSPG